MTFSEREEKARRLFEDLTEAGDAPPPDAVLPLPEFARYRARARLGEGATAIVYRAWDAELGREVALKVLRPGSGLSDVTRQRFRREARAAAGLAHPNVLTVHDVGEEQGLLFLVLELVDGAPFRLRSDRPLEERVAILEKAARGVGAAHRNGIVHRDLKPANILVTPRGEPKVGDFGLAHLMEGSAELTKTGTTLGTPRYMAPEQVEGRSGEISPRTDVYALGVMLYEILAGRPPFEADTVAELYGRILREDPAPPRRHDPAAPPALERVCLVALEKDPRRRYADADAFADELGRHRSGEPVLAKPRPAALRAFARAWKRPAVRAAAAVLLAVALLGGTLSIQKRSRVRAALRAAEAKEREGDADEARVAFRIALDLQPGNPEALAGLARLDGPPGDPATLPRLERVRGDVVLAGPGTIVPARDRMAVRPGQAVRTLSDAATARVTFPDSARLDLRPLTAVRGCAERRPHVEAGAVEAAGPLTVATPHAEVEIAAGAAVLEVDGPGTRVEVAEGHARLTRRSDGATAAVPAGFTAATRGGPEIGVRPAAGDEILLTPPQGVVSGNDWALVRKPESASGFALEAARQGPAEHWAPLLNARTAGAVEFTFWARADRTYFVWVRGRAPARDIKLDAVFLKFEQAEFLLRPKRIWAFLDLEGAVANGFYRKDHAWWVGGDADADGDLPPMAVRFSRTGLQTLRLYPFETPIRIEAVWLSTTQKDRPPADRKGPR
jgi:tRNA A-37 threonylcarbamoyl transferase component Bud32